jgi:hypothetical protein
MILLSEASEAVRAAFVIANFLACTFVGWACICRFARMSARTVRLEYRLRYVLLMVAASASGWSFLWGEPAGPGALSMVVATIVGLLVSAPRWRQAPPEEVRPPEAPAGLPPAALRVVGGGNERP